MELEYKEVILSRRLKSLSAVRASEIKKRSFIPDANGNRSKEKRFLSEMHGKI